jgi:hypothetical protein
MARAAFAPVSNEESARAAPGWRLQSFCALSALYSLLQHRSGLELRAARKKDFRLHPSRGEMFDV